MCARVCVCVRVCEVSPITKWLRRGWLLNSEYNAPFIKAKLVRATLRGLNYSEFNPCRVARTILFFNKRRVIFQ